MTSLDASRLPVFGLDIVCKRLGVLGAVVVVMPVVVVSRPDVVHLVDTATLGAPLDGAFAGYLYGVKIPR